MRKEEIDEIDEITTFLENNGTQFIRYIWCGNSNIIRGKAVHINRLEAYLQDGIGISAAHQAYPAIADYMIAGSGISISEEIRMVADWDTLTVLPYAAGHARVLTDLFKEGQPWSCCPRHFLKRMIKEAANEGLKIVAAFENEFFLLDSSESKLIPANNTVLSGSSWTMDLQHGLINDISEALINQDVPVELYHPESGPGHHEISVSHTHALSAADQQIVFRETVKAVAHQHHLIASFLPKIFSAMEGSGCHLHLSLWQNGINCLPDGEKKGELSEVAKCFIAGLLHHLPALMALTAPTSNSYERIQPDLNSGAYNCWGFNNREAAVRVPTNPSPPSPTHFELKTADASSNPYLALGGVIAAGLDGIRRSLQLAEPITTNPDSIAESEREARGIYRLPIHLGAAITELEQDEVLLEALGTDLAQSYLAVKKKEWGVMKEYSLEQEVQMLLERY